MGVITGRIVGASGPTALPLPTVGQVVESVTDLRALVGSVGLPAVSLLQYSGAMPLRGGGVFEWDAAAAADDGGLRFNAGGVGSSGAGWRRIVTTSIGEGDWFGITADGGTDDTAALLRAVAAYEGGELLLPSGTINYTSTLAIPSSTVVRGAGPGSTILNYLGSAVAVTIGDDPGTGVTYVTNASLRDVQIVTTSAPQQVLWLWRAVHCSVDNVAITSGGADKESVMCDYCVNLGLRSLVLNGSVGASGVTSNYRNGVRIDNCTTVTLDRGYLGNCKKVLWLNSSFGVTAHGTILESSWSGAVLQSGSQLTLHGGYIENCGDTGTDTGFACYLEDESQLTAHGCHVLGYASIPFAADVRDTSRLEISGGRWRSNYVGTPTLVRAATFTSGRVAITAADINFDVGGVPTYRDGVINGDGPPDGVVDGTRGTLYVDTGTLSIPGEGTLYVATQASGNTGWVPVGAANATATGSRTYVTDQWHIQYRRLQLTSTQRLTLAGTARYILTDL